MELLAAPRQQAPVWTCPECGHGSPEPRDRRAHVDAHRQLRQFFEDWDAAAAADSAAERRTPRRRLAYGVVALVLVLAAVLGLRELGPRQSAPVIPGPVPGVDLPQPGPSGPAAATAPPTPAPTANPAVPPSPTEAAVGRPARSPAATPAAADPAPISAEPRTTPATAAPASPAAPVPAATAPPATPAPPGLRVCLLDICLVGQ